MDGSGRYREAWIRARSRMLMLEVDYLAANSQGPASLRALHTPSMPLPLQARVQFEQRMLSAPTSLLRPCTPLISPSLGVSVASQLPQHATAMAQVHQSQHQSHGTALPTSRKHPRDSSSELEEPRDGSTLPDIDVGLAERAPSIDTMAQAQIRRGAIGSRSLEDDEARSAAWAAGFLLSLSPGGTPPPMSPCQSRMASQDINLQDLSLQADDWVERDELPTGEATAGPSWRSPLSVGGAIPSALTGPLAPAPSASSVTAEMWKKRQRLSRDE